MPVHPVNVYPERAVAVVVIDVPEYSFMAHPTLLVGLAT